MTKRKVAILLAVMFGIIVAAIIVQVKTIEGANSPVLKIIANDNLRDEVLIWKDKYDVSQNDLEKSEKKLEKVRQQAAKNDENFGEKEEKIKKYLEESGIEYKDYGCDSLDSVDYPVYAKKVAHAILDGECEKGILICGTGIGISITANKFKGIRAAAVMNEESAKFAKADDDINVITLGGDYLTTNEAICIIRNWLATKFKGGRYEERLKMVEEIEKNNMK